MEEVRKPERSKFAFPRRATDDTDGMELRDFFAAFVLAAWLLKNDNDRNWRKMARDAYDIADYLAQAR